MSEQELLDDEPYEDDSFATGDLDEEGAAGTDEGELSADVILEDDDLEDDELEDDLGSDLDDDLDSFDDEDEEPVGDAGALDAVGDDDDEDTGEPAVDLAAIDGLDVQVEDDDEDQDEDDGLRDGEFVCRSCHMARRGSALADPDEMLCRDCV